MRGDIFSLSARELKRLSVLERAIIGEITVRQAAKSLKLSERQVKRLKKRIRRAGPAGVAHGNRDRAPKHRVPESVRQVILTLATGDYHGASFNHMAELLQEREGIGVSPKTVGRILKLADISSPYTHKAPRRRRSRDRRPREGDLVQIDASPHDWLEGRGPRMNLHGAIDDATGKVLALFFRPTEDIRGYQELFTRMFLAHGIPLSIYSDGHSMFFPPEKDKDKLTIAEELKGKEVSLTQIGTMLESLDIDHIHALSPQAKGRVERLWETLHGRLVIELRLAGVTSIDQANTFLPGFIAKYNKKFAVQPAFPEPTYRPAPPRAALDRILALKETRHASNGSTISYSGRIYQLIKQDGEVAALRAHAEVSVLTHINGRLTAICEGREFDLKPFTPFPPHKNQPVVLAPRKSSAHQPAKDHPWRSRGPLAPRWDPIDDYLRRKDRDWQRLMAQR